MLKKTAKLAALRVLRYPHRIVPRILQRQGSAPAFADGVSFQTLLDRSRRLAGHWAGAGITKGERVLIDLPNCREFVEARLAAILAGAVAVPIPRASSDTLLGHIAQTTEARAYLGTRAAAVHGIAAPLDLGNRAEDTEGYERALVAATPLHTSPPLRGEDLLAINFTSGSTGSPKGVMSTIAAWGWSLYYSLRENRAPIGRDEVFLHALPLSTAGSSLLLPAVLSGSRSLFLQDWDVAEACRTIEQHGVTRLFLTPTMLAELCTALRGSHTDTRSLRAVIYGTEGIPVARIRKAFHLLGPVLQQGYGMAEALPPIAILHQDQHARAMREGDNETLASAGKPTAAVQVRIVSPEDQPVAPGASGHIQVRGKTVSPGYWKQPERTAQTRAGEFYRTGDIGHLDARGLLHVEGRAGTTLSHAAKDLVEWAETRDDTCLAWAQETGEQIALHLVPSTTCRRDALESATGEAMQRTTGRKDLAVHVHTEAPKTGSFKLAIERVPTSDSATPSPLHGRRQDPWKS